MVLCGHTHGGQVVVPLYGPPVTLIRIHRRYASGWSQMGPTRMYTGRGLASHLSLRFLCRPEVAVFTLRREERE
jgi:predicted MPP superfamily phosphohydrolase